MAYIRLNNTQIVVADYIPKNLNEKVIALGWNPENQFFAEKMSDKEIEYRLHFLEGLIKKQIEINPTTNILLVLYRITDFYKHNGNYQNKPRFATMN